jgi:O-antigen/teichoic acid export membrane protein
MIGFALGACATAAVSACVAWWLAGREAAVAPWAAIGFVAMAVPGIAFGTWLAREHGRPGSRFLVALASGFVARLVLAAVAAFGASRSGGGAGFGLICGLAAGFAPLTVFETIWFASRSRGSTRQTETGA